MGGPHTDGEVQAGTVDLIMKNLILSLLLIALPASKAFAADSDAACTSQPGTIGGYFLFEILQDKDLRDAIRCAVNRAGLDVTGESAFSRIYNVTLPDEFVPRIQYVRSGDYDPVSGRINTYKVKFPAVYGDQLETKVNCIMRVETRRHHDRPAVLISLSECRTSTFGLVQHEGKSIPLDAWALFAFEKKK